MAVLCSSLMSLGTYFRIVKHQPKHCIFVNCSYFFLLKRRWFVLPPISGQKSCGCGFVRQQLHRILVDHFFALFSGRYSFKTRSRRFRPELHLKMRRARFQDWKSQRRSQNNIYLEKPKEVWLFRFDEKVFSSSFLR